MAPGPYFTNSAQPYYGPVYGDTVASRDFMRRGQDSQYTLRRFMRQDGRYLAGFGAYGTPSGPGGDANPDFAEGDINRMEGSDDTWGSGVFDPPGREATANVNTGIFASSYSLPGFIAREIPFTVSRDVSDLTNDAAMVFIPGGGLQYVEVGGRLVPPQVLGPTERFGGRRPPQSGTTREEVYVSLQSPNPRPTLNAGAPVREPASYHPARNNWAWVTPVPEPASRVLPFGDLDSNARARMDLDSNARMDLDSNARRRVGSTSIVSGAGGARVAIGPMQQPTLQGFGRLPRKLKARAMGADEPTSGASVAQYAIAGLLVGGAIGAAVTIFKKGK